MTVETPRTLPFWQLMCLYALLPLWMLFQGYGMAVRLVSGVIVVAIFGGAIAYQTRALRRDREIGVVMAVTPEGLWRIHGAGTARAPIPWSGITQIDFGLYDFRSRIRLTSGKVEYLPMGFKDQASYNAFVAACRHYGERAGLTFGHRGRLTGVVTSAVTRCSYRSVARHMPALSARSMAQACGCRCSG